MTLRKALLGAGAGIAAGYAFVRTLEAVREYRAPSPPRPKDARHTLGSGEPSTFRHVARNGRIRRLCVWSDSAPARPHGRLRAGMASAGVFFRAAFAGKRFARSSGRVRARLHPRTPFWAERSNARRLAGRICKEHPAGNRADCFSGNAVRRRRSQSAPPLAVACKSRNASALRCRQRHRTDVRAASLQ